MKRLICFLLICFVAGACGIAFGQDSYTHDNYDYDKEEEYTPSDEGSGGYHEVDGTDASGDYVTGEVEISDGEGEGMVSDLEGNMSDIEVDSTDQGQMQAHSDDGEEFEVDSD